MVCDDQVLLTLQYSTQWDSLAHVGQSFDADGDGAAEDVYRRLIERAPRDFKMRGRAEEAMLSLKEPAKALRFAEEGAAAARQANDRGSEEYMKELVAAAKKQ